MLSTWNSCGMLCLGPPLRGRQRGMRPLLKDSVEDGWRIPLASFHPLRQRECVFDRKKKYKNLLLKPVCPNFFWSLRFRNGLQTLGWRSRLLNVTHFHKPGEAVRDHQVPSLGLFNVYYVFIILLRFCFSFSLDVSLDCFCLVFYRGWD